jgi:beta-glucosidase
MSRIDEQVGDLLSRMTLTEKIGQINTRLLGFNCYKKDGDEFFPNEMFIEEVRQFGGIGFLYGLFRADPWSRKTYRNGISGKDMAKTANRFQRYVIENTRLKIPVLICTEVPHGHQALDGYLLPVNLAMACTFNPELVKEGFRTVAKQIRAAGIHVGFVSALDMLREPRWGRSEECYSEDPYLASFLAEAAVDGLQGGKNGNIGNESVMAVVKHFCAQGTCTGGLNAAPAPIGERELREFHLSGSKACCEAGVKGFMAAYNEIDGIPCHANEKLLRGILRKEFGFDGIVMSDGHALDRLQCLTSSPEESAALALRAGVDVSMWDSVFPLLAEAVEKKLVPENFLDDAVRRVLKLKYEMGLFENPYIDEKRYVPINHNSEKYPASLELARQSVVLLKNDGNILPLDLSNVKTISIIGPNGNDIYNQIGDYSATQKEGDYSTLFDGIKCIARGAKVLYAKGCNIRGQDSTMLDAAIEAAKKADVIILAVGGSSKRNFDIQFDSNGAVLSTSLNSVEMDCGEGVDVSDLALGGIQTRLITEVEKLNKPTIVVAVQGRPVCLSGIGAKAIICSFYPGPVGGRALAEIIFGKIVPSGKLSASLPAYPHQTNFYYNRKISVDKLRYIDREAKPLYPFGYGLSYTSFVYDELRISKTLICVEELEKGECFQISVRISNVGKFDAYEVAQMYIMAKTSPVTRRVKELKGFRKIFIKSGESSIVNFSLGKNELSIWDSNMKFVIPETEVIVYCGTNSEENLQDNIKIIGP